MKYPYLDLYLNSYHDGVDWIRCVRVGWGWAGGKGKLKEALKRAIRFPRAYPPGYLDALLDSVN